MSGSEARASLASRQIRPSLLYKILKRPQTLNFQSSSLQPHSHPFQSQITAAVDTISLHGRMKNKPNLHFPKNIPTGNPKIYALSTFTSISVKFQSRSHLCREPLKLLSVLLPACLPACIHENK